MYSGSIWDIEGLQCGHAQDEKARTGCSVVLCPPGATAAVDVRGAAPGTRETDLLEQGMLVQAVHGILLAGGSAYGLDAAGGVMRYLESQNIGLETGFAKVPIVCAAVLYDLGVGSPLVRPDADMGYEACVQAQRSRMLQGRVGAGCGATVGKLPGEAYAQPGGIGTASLKLPDGTTVAALMAVNALGDIRDAQGSGEIIAGAKRNGRFLNAGRYLLEGNEAAPEPFRNTTIGVVATDAKLDKGQLKRLCYSAQDGLALAIHPAHTLYDGDTVFALSTGHRPAPDMVALGAAGTAVTARAIANAVWAAEEQGCD